MGRDMDTIGERVRHLHFNPRAPYGARQIGQVTCQLPAHFNPRAPYGARRGRHAADAERGHFNPRAPYGARPVSTGGFDTAGAFQSTRPVWGATPFDVYIQAGTDISIHAPRMGRDIAFGRNGHKGRYFNPRAPYGARLRTARTAVTAAEFQSTRPVWGATPSPAPPR